jgi:hypothetical protein
MKTFPSPPTEEDIKQIIRDWVDLLAQERFDEAAEMLLPEVIPGNGSISEKQYSAWTGDLIRDVLHYGGNPTPYEGQREFYKVVALPDSLQERFEALLDVYIYPLGTSDTTNIGQVHVDLPMIVTTRTESTTIYFEMTARMYIRDLGNRKIGFVLEDIHVM